jgi:hypothetical protein
MSDGTADINACAAALGIGQKSGTFQPSSQAAPESNDDSGHS